MDGGVFVGDKVAEDVGAGGGEDALGPPLVLDGYGDAVHGAAIKALGDSPLRVFGVGAGFVGADGDVGVEDGVQGFDPVKVGLHHVYGGDLAGPNLLGKVSDGEEGKVIEVHA